MDERLKLLSFTGSPGVGWDLKARAGKKKVVLELGGNAAVIVDSDADAADAVERIVFGAFYQSGQSCISVQRILIHASIYDAFREAHSPRPWPALVKGDPRDPKTFIGPMISEKEATRLHGWIESAVAGGAKLLCGGTRDGAMLDATLLENVPADSEVACQEAFGPVAVLEPFDDFEAALARVNDSVFGLQAGVFTRDIVQGPARLGRARGRRRGDRRRAVVAGRQHAVRRREGLRARPRGHPLRHGGHDGDPPDGGPRRLERLFRRRARSLASRPMGRRGHGVQGLEASGAQVRALVHQAVVPGRTPARIGAQALAVFPAGLAHGAVPRTLAAGTVLPQLCEPGALLRGQQSLDLDQRPEPGDPVVGLELTEPSGLRDHGRLVDGISCEQRTHGVVGLVEGHAELIVGFA